MQSFSPSLIKALFLLFQSYIQTHNIEKSNLYLDKMIEILNFNYEIHPFAIKILLIFGEVLLKEN